MKKIFFIALTMLLLSGQKLWADVGFSDIDGTTITIHNTDEMALLAQNVNDGNTYEGYTFILATDLNYDRNTENNYTSIGNYKGQKPFSGTFDGNGKTIKGININAEGNQGLFGYVSGGNIKNLTLTESTIITKTSSVGGIVGLISTRVANSDDNDVVNIENCHVTSSVTIESLSKGGGIVGSSLLGTVNIKGCSSGATVSTENCISGMGCVGGIIGQCGNTEGKYTTEVNISGCFYYGMSSTSLKGNTKQIGSIIGYSYATYGPNQILIYTSVINLVDNFYTYPDASVKGIGKWRSSNGITVNDEMNIDIFESNGAIRVRPVTAQADIEDMGDQKNDVAYTENIVYYDRGIKFADTFYSHMLALENDADNTSIINTYAGQTFDVKLRGRRFYKDDSWNTICLPFIVPYQGTIFESVTDCVCEIREMDTESYYQVKDKTTGELIPNLLYRTGVMEKDGKRSLYLFFKKYYVDLEAGKPYIVKWQKAKDYSPTTAPSYDIFDPIFDNVTIDNKEPIPISSLDSYISINSLYKPISFESEDRSILFVGADNTLYYPSGAGTVSLKSFRAYFRLNGYQMASDPDSGDDNEEFIPTGGGSAKAFVIGLEEDESTGIKAITPSDNITNSQSIYDLSGRKVTGSKLSKGIYIVNGRKEVLK